MLLFKLTFFKDICAIRALEEIIGLLKVFFMCGLVGYMRMGESLSRNIELPILKSMTDVINFRGPDDEGHEIIGPCALGHRRLAIIDLEPRSAQPLSTVDKDLWIVFNGEIYNYLDIKAELIALGHAFHTESDTEVILASYRQWGVDMLEKFRGMFAFCIWDVKKERLFMARDRFGKKPLYYFRNESTLIFASEIKSLIRYPDFPRRINMQSIYDYLSYGYCVGESTAFAGVRRLLPGHFMLIEKDGRTTTHKYWELSEVNSSLGRRSRDSLAEELVERFDEALNYRLIADVPVGAFLSGGVDSSAVVARAAPLLNTKLKTFSVGFDIEGFDETVYAREVAERYETEHHSFMMDYNIIEELPKIIWHYGEPYADSSAIVTYTLAREVRKYVTVGITGDGGDEVLLGYSRYMRLRDTVEGIHKGTAKRDMNFKIGLDQTAPLMRDVYSRSMFKFRNEHLLWGAGDAILPYLMNQPSDALGLLLEESEYNTAVDRAARTDCNVYLPDDLLIKADIATMAHSLEGRSPFLDHNFADWAASIPQNKRIFKRHGAIQSKGLLKYAMEPYLPHGCMYRRKMGFSVPVAHWMKHELKDFLIQTLTSQKFKDRQFINHEFIKFMIHRHMNNIEDHGTRLWVLLCLELWCQTYIDADGSKPLNINVTGGSADLMREVA